jgi:hypothetical protein
MANKSGKVTYKELNDRMTMFFDRIGQMHQNMDYIHTLTMKYIEYKGDNADFLKWVEKDRKKQEKKAREDDSKVK